MRRRFWIVAMIAGAALVAGSPIAFAVQADSTDLPIAQCELRAPAGRDVSVGVNRPEGRLKPLGTVSVTFLLVDFPDAPATAAARAQAKATISGVRSFASAQSYGRLAIALLIVDQWLRMPKAAAAYSAADDGSYTAHKAYLQDAIDAAPSSAGISTSDVVVVLASYEIGGLAGGAAFLQLPGGGIDTNGAEVLHAVSVGTIKDGSDVGVLGHEFLHTLGLADLYNSNPSAGEPYRFTGPFDLMADVSAASPSVTAWEKWVLGWLDDSQVRCVGPGTTTVALTPVERMGGTKAVIAPIGGGRAVVVESRAAVGVDANGPAGVIVYLVDPGRESGHGPIRLARARGLVMTPLAAGQSISLHGVHVTVNSGGQVSVRVPRRPA
ncbi:MAG: hypothetical protein PSX37_06870 [bacterium]|nr:hypothetical protein [bacterium]